MSTIVAPERKRAGSSNPLASVAELLASAGDIGEALNGKKVTTKTSGGTVSTGLDISQAGVDKILSDILSSTQGLAAVSSGQKSAGLYNSTTNQQLVNDLTSRTAGEVGKLQSKTVQSTSPTQSTVINAPRADIGTTLMTTAAGVGAKKLFDLFSSEGGGAVVNNVGSDLVAGVQGLLGTDGSAEILSNLGGDLGGDIAGELFGGIDFLGDTGIASGLPLVGMGLDFLSGKPEDALASGAGFLLGNALLPGAGGPIGSIISEILPVGDIFDGLFGGSVVCTELYSQGIMSKYLYTVDVLYAKHAMEERTLNGYRYWGIPLVKLMRKSKRVTNIVAWFAVARAHYVVSTFPDGLYNAKLARRGKWINRIGVPICNLIAAVTTPKDYSQLYVRKAG